MEMLNHQKWEQIFARKSSHMKLLNSEEIVTNCRHKIYTQSRGNSKVFITKNRGVIYFTHKTHYIICDVNDPTDVYPIDKNTFDNLYQKVEGTDHYINPFITIFYRYIGDEPLVLANYDDKKGESLPNTSDDSKYCITVKKGDIVGINYTKNSFYLVENFHDQYEVIN